jgi:hypothetical protein
VSGQATTAPSGWYLDPDDDAFFRWWDGTTWVDDWREVVLPAGRPKRWYRSGLVWALLLLVAVCGLAMRQCAQVVTTPSPLDQPGALDATAACVQSAEAITEYSHGQRSLTSTLDALQHEEPVARRAAGQDPKYAFLPWAIVAAEEELSTGRPGVPGVGRLLAECGPTRGQS